MAWAFTLGQHSFLNILENIIQELDYISASAGLLNRTELLAPAGSMSLCYKASKWVIVLPVLYF